MEDKLFKAVNFAKLDAPERKKRLPQNEILSAIGFEEGDIAADIGCGVGYFSFPIAELVGLEGKVYALDLQQGMLDELAKRILVSEAESAKKIETILTKPSDLILETGTANTGILSTVLHEVDDPVGFLKEISRILRTDGKLAVIEWKKEKMESGPPTDHRISETELAQLLKEAGYKSSEVRFRNEFFYLVVAAC